MKNTWTWIVLAILIVLAIWWYMAGNGDTNPTVDDEDTNTTVEIEATEGEYKDVTVAEAQVLMAAKSNLVVLDVSDKYAEGRLPKAINYPVGDGSLDAAISSLNKNVPYLVYCHVDSASISGAQKLVDAGFKEVYRLEGNYAAWTAAGLEVEL